MKLTATLDGFASLARYDPEPLLARLRADLERELQAAVTSGAPPGLGLRRADPTRALVRAQARGVRS
jgi:hypothetical protein